MTVPLRVGSVGVGWWGGQLAERASRAGMEMVRCFARTPAAREAFAARYGGRPAETLDELLDDRKVEAVLISTPHSTHADIVEQVAAAGKHIFIEKPLALNVADGRRAIDAATTAGVVLQVGHKRRRQLANRRIKELIEAGQLGDVHHLEAYLSYSKGLEARTGWRADPAENPGGGMTGLGVHMIDNLLYLAGPVARVAAFSKRLHPVGDLDNVTTANLEFKGGPLGFIGTSTAIPRVARTCAFGTRAAAWNEDDGSRFFLQHVGEDERTEEPIAEVDTIRDQLEEFVRCVRTGGEPEVGGEQGLAVVAVFQAIIESARSGQVIDVDDIHGRSRNRENA